MRLKLIVAALAAACLSVPAMAGTIRHFEPALFQSLNAKGDPVVVFVHAPWCPVCRAQEKTINEELNKPGNEHLNVLVVDYDTEQKIWKPMGVRQQSTLIAFHHGRETKRLAYDTNPDNIRGLISAAVK